MSGSIFPPCSAREPAADAWHVYGGTQLKSFHGELFEAHVDGVVSYRWPLLGASDAVLADHVRHPDRFLHLDHLHCAESKIILAATRIPRSVRVLCLWPAFADRKDEALSPCPDVVADVGDDLRTRCLRGCGVPAEIHHRGHSHSFTYRVPRRQS